MNSESPLVPNAQRTDRSIESSTLGIIIPCHNEEEVIPALIKALDAFKSDVAFDVWFLFVDDGSTDQSFHLLCEACEARERFGVVRLSRNFGQQAAIAAGMSIVPGDLVAIIDADLQDPLDAIPAMMKRWEEGYDVVYGIRQNRKENFVLRIAYGAFYRVWKTISDIDVPLDAGDFAVLDRKIVLHLNAFPEHNRFLRGLRGWLGFKQIGVPYERAARYAGNPSYGVRKLIKLALDGLVSFSWVPLRLAGWLGFASASLGFFYLLFSVVCALFLKRTPPGWASLVVVFVFFGGIQLIVLGILGEYVGRIFDEVKRRPLFVTDGAAGWVDRRAGMGLQ